MAETNFGILDTQLPGRIAAIPQQAQAQQTQNMLTALQAQHSMNQNELARYQLSSARRADSEAEQMRALFGGATPTSMTDPEFIRKIYAVSPEKGIALEKAIAERKKSGLEQTETQGKITAQQVRLAADRMAQVREQLSSIAQNPTDANVSSAFRRAVDLGMPMIEATQHEQEILKLPLAERTGKLSMLGLQAEKRQAALTEHFQAFGGKVFQTNANVPGGLKSVADVPAVNRLLTPAEEEQRVRIAGASRAPRPEAAPRTQQVTMSNGGLGIVNMDTGVITPSTMNGAPVKGKPSAFAEKTALQRTQMGKDLEFAITQLTDITKDGGLIDQSTGSGVGRLVDLSARAVGQATSGDIAIGEIAPIADLALKMVPRFEGPQSNKDTASYNAAAGQLADSSLPTKIRKNAGKVVLRIMKARKDQFATTNMAAEGAPSGSGVVDFGSLK